jgi:nicotinamidase-related amidase
VPEREKGSRLAKRDRTAFLVVDFQEKFMPVIPEAEAILAHLVRICRAARILRVPLLVTEQYPKGLGQTVPELWPYLDGVERIEKVCFSCFGEPKFTGMLEGLKVDTLILAGIEAHVCVAQTAFDAIEAGYQVHILEDAVGSRDPRNARIALDRLREAGAVISSTEMALFELLGRAGTPEFKEIQQLVI